MTAPLPLAGIKVLDLSRVLAGPYCCSMLGSVGAEVIKVERPGAGDESRRYGHLWKDVSFDFMNVNLNKRDITVDLHSAEGQEIIRRLAAEADVLVENFKPGTLDRLGLGYADLQPLNPELIYCSISAYGEHGAYSGKPGYDGALQAFSGHMSITGEPDGGPCRTGASVVDMSTGIAAYGAVMTALYGRRQGGGGQKLTVSLLHTALALMGSHGAVCLNTGHEPTRAGSGVSHLAPYAAYRTRDGYVVVGALNDAAWRRICGVLGRQELLEDPRFVDMQARLRHRRELNVTLEETFSTRPSADWMPVFEEAGLVISLVNSLGDAVNHPQVAANDLLARLETPDGVLRFVRGPMTFGAWETAHDLPPQLGEHTREILRDLGYPPERIDALRDAGAI